MVKMISDGACIFVSWMRKKNWPFVFKGLNWRAFRLCSSFSFIKSAVVWFSDRCSVPIEQKGDIEF